MYYNTEIDIRKCWIYWLANFQIGEAKPIDEKDRAKIACSISNNFHRKKGRNERFKIKYNKTSKELEVIRVL